MMTIVKKLISKGKSIQLRMPTEENAVTVHIAVGMNHVPLHLDFVSDAEAMHNM